jgi:hypothetical protein
MFIAANGTAWRCGVIRRLELKPDSEQKVENMFVTSPYCHTACRLPGFRILKGQLNVN